ncbi:hypothetical protein SRRS_46150 [Sporomusa rhizae]|uniref:hypothetical protein n=1 Tax=Sporomusa rhizae TaxID=357999 RepID=UPI00352AE1D5
MWSGIIFANPAALSIPGADKIPEVIRLNGERKSEGYYLSEVEFKLLGIAYYLDREDFATASTKLDQLYHQLNSKEGLIKVPRFANKNKELEYYLNLQNPKTGAFMDDSYPLFTYVAPTLNMLEHLEFLAKETGQPLRLKYPLSFLDKINTGEKLKAYLDDFALVGPIGSRLPKTPYIAVTEIIDYREIERNKLYTFSPEWKRALMQWYYDNQDIKTGFWGPRLRDSGEFANSGELGTTYHVAKLFVDEEGKEYSPEFPLRYKDKMFATTLQKLSEPMPVDVAEVHDWSFTRYQGIRLLTDFLWSDASTEEKARARRLMESTVRNRFEKFYIEQEGAFSLYPGAQKADLDGTGTALSLLRVVGALSQKQKERLYGFSDETIRDLGVYKVSNLKENDFTMIKNTEGITSIRLYRADPALGSYTANVVSVIYPNKTPVLDIVDLVPRMNRWVNTTPQTIGNWVSKESVIQDLSAFKIEAVPVAQGNIPLKLANEVLQTNRELIVIGFDIMQVPRVKIIYKSNESGDGSLTHHY